MESCHFWQVCMIWFVWFKLCKFVLKTSSFSFHASLWFMLINFVMNDIRLRPWTIVDQFCSGLAGHVQLLDLGRDRVFVRKWNEKNEIVRYKARLVAQGFSQRPGIDYEETCSPVMDSITFRYLISLAVQEKLHMHLMDIVTTYLYGTLDTEIFMKISEGFKMSEAFKNSREVCSIWLQKSLYGLKQSRRICEINVLVNIWLRKDTRMIQFVHVFL